MMESEMKEDPNEGPPRKRLLTDPNPRGSLVSASQESTVSSDSSSDRFAKKTRELPNLSDCHSCAVRINYMNPRERLQPLNSMWRVVLLCKKCTKRVKSSELCPYCFSVVVDENDCFKCRDCQHSIHKDCVAKYGSRLGFSVCVDCWIPDAVANSIRVRKRKNKKKNKESCERTATLPESKISVPETIEPSLVGEEMEKEVAAAAETSENALRKAGVAKVSVELGKSVLNVVASTKVAGSCERKVVDDTQLAFMLHRAINSSPRISRYACFTSSSSRDNAPITCYSRRRASKKISSMNSSKMDVPLICYSRRCGKGGLRKSASLDGPLMCYSRRRSSSKACLNVRECESFTCKISERIDKHVSIPSAGVKASYCASSAENSLNRNECQVNDGVRLDMRPQRYLLTYHRLGKGTQRPSVFIKDSDCDTRNFWNGKECPEICEKRDKNTDRFLLKFKRSVRSKPDFSCKVDEFYPVLPSNHPKESSILCDARFQSSYKAPSSLGPSQGEL